MLTLALALLGSGQSHWLSAHAAPQTPPEQVWFSQSRPHPAALELVKTLRNARDHGLDPFDYNIAAIERGLADAQPATRQETEHLLTAALVAYARDLRLPRGTSETIYIDAELKAAAPDAEWLLAQGSPADRLRSLHADNPLYEGLRSGLARYRSRWASLPEIQIPEGPTLTVGSRGKRVVLLRERLGLASNGPQADEFDASLGAKISQFRDEHGLKPGQAADRVTVQALNRGASHYERIIGINLDRLRGLPLGGERYVLVDTAAAQLRMIEDGRTVDTMRVVVGKRGAQTPPLAAFIRYAVVNPYWNVPPDLVQNSIAPQVLREGLGALKRRNYVLSTDWQSDKQLNPREIDWPAVAAGRKTVWVRQLPGGGNMMGAVKFMLPNEYGIYLHDTPNKLLFQRDERRLSNGCVRLEDAPRLARWLFNGRQVLDGSSTPEKRVDLLKPVPVFITYLTASFEGGRILFRPDVEQRDAALLTQEGSLG